MERKGNGRRDSPWPWQLWGLVPLLSLTVPSGQVVCDHTTPVKTA
jgi:hypothetical protein